MDIDPTMVSDGDAAFEMWAQEASPGAAAMSAAEAAASAVGGVAAGGVAAAEKERDPKKVRGDGGDGGGGGGGDRSEEKSEGGSGSTLGSTGLEHPLKKTFGRRSRLGRCLARFSCCCVAIMGCCYGPERAEGASTQGDLPFTLCALPPLYRSEKRFCVSSSQTAPQSVLALETRGRRRILQVHRKEEVQGGKDKEKREERRENLQCFIYSSKSSQ